MHPTFASYNNRIFYTSRVSAFSFYLKKKTPAKEKQTQGCAPRPRERHATVLSLRLSVSCSAHSPVNSLRSNSTGNVAEAPPVADEARRCWRKTRSIAPAPRAIGDYVLRGLCVLLRKPFPRSSWKPDYKSCWIARFYFANVCIKKPRQSLLPGAKTVL